MNTRKSALGFGRRGLLAVVPLLIVALSDIGPLWAQTKKQSGKPTPTQNEGQPLTGVETSTKNPLQVAILHWYNANQTSSFAVGLDPTAVAFDGADIWVANGLK